MSSGSYLESLTTSLPQDAAVSAIEILLKITQNVLDNPHEERFKQIKIANKSFSSKVWQYPQARDFMLSTGWTLVDDMVVLICDLQLHNVLEELTVIKSSLEPAGSSSSQMAAAPQVDRKDASLSAQEKERAERMEKLREMQRKAKEEKQRVLKQVMDDRREMEQREAKASHSRSLEFGAKLNGFKDIGVDLNSGGG